MYSLPGSHKIPIPHFMENKTKDQVKVNTA